MSSASQRSSLSGISTKSMFAKSEVKARETKSL